MDGNNAILIGLVVGAVVGLLAYIVYRSRQRRRVYRVEKRVKEYLSGRYGKLPRPLRINCSDDLRWPVLVDFEGPGTGVRHRLQFACAGAGFSLSLLCDTEESR